MFIVLIIAKINCGKDTIIKIFINRKFDLYCIYNVNNCYVRFTKNSVWLNVFLKKDDQQVLF